jgi:SAM-dependent MidA family methyltransferase
MEDALYGDRGFFRLERPADHFRTSAHTGPAFAGALVALLAQVDAALGTPDRLDVVDIGAGRGELLTHMLALAPATLAARLTPVAVEVAARPVDLRPEIEWRSEVPDGINGLVLACEWLDNVPLDVASDLHYVEVDDAGLETAGELLDDDDLNWQRQWWPDGGRVEIGGTRDHAWAGVIGRMRAGLALAVDYGHLRTQRPPLGTLTGFRHGAEVPPVPNGSCDLTAHVAMDAVAAAGSAVAELPAHLVRQSDALRALGISGARPPLDQASFDPVGYLRALAAASTAAELTDHAGLGDHFWLRQPVAIAWAP